MNKPSANDLSFILAEIMCIYRLTRGHLRFGQIIGNAFSGDLYYVTNDAMQEALRQYRAVLEEQEGTR